MNVHTPERQKDESQEAYRARRRLSQAIVKDMRRGIHRATPPGPLVNPVRRAKKAGVQHG